MREILFRGKRIDNGEWMYGLLDNEEHDADFTAILPHRNERHNYDDWAVDPTTVGQYTGLTEQNRILYRRDVAAFRNINELFSFGVTHWMPLPEPPKED